MGALQGIGEKKPPITRVESKSSLSYPAALAIISAIAGAITTGCLFRSIGSWAFIASGIGVLPGSVFIIRHFCTAKAEEETLLASISVPLPTSGEPTLAQKRKEFLPPGVLRNRTCMVHYSFIQSTEDGRAALDRAREYYNDPSSCPPELCFQIGALLGMAIGDALGAPLEFLPLTGKKYATDDLSMKPGERVGILQDNELNWTEPGQWTDDTSMGLCLADVLIANKKLEGKQLMFAFTDWWDHGYNNAFTGEIPKGSVGLGGNINKSFKLFAASNCSDAETGSFVSTAEDKFASGNGSLMRLAPVAIAARTIEEARALAREQSLTTHQGEEAAGCAELMAALLFIAIHSKKDEVDDIQDELRTYMQNFVCEGVPSVEALAKSKVGVNPKNKEEENWNWAAGNFSYNEARRKLLPGYVGAYAMDALAMALHCVFSTKTFGDAVKKAVSYGGDADSVGAITGQIAGAIYGVHYKKGIPRDWIDAVQQWDRNGEIAARAILLANKRDN